MVRRDLHDHMRRYRALLGAQERTRSPAELLGARTGAEQSSRRWVVLRNDGSSSADCWWWCVLLRALDNVPT
jgi:hypothetical protein